MDRPFALITGGSGYFGSVLRDRLCERGWRVRVFDLNDADDRPPDVEFVHGDVRNPEAVARAVKGCTVVFHCVAQVPLAKDKNLFWSVNVDGTQNLLEAARRARVQKVVHVSSSAVFGAPKTNPVTERTEPRPGEPYGRAKLAAEQVCQEFVSSGLDITIIRPRTIMGHGRLGIFQILFEWIRQGYNVPVLGRGENRYQFVHADDLAAACILAACRPGPAVYNCGTDRFGTMRELLEHLCHYAGTGSRVKSVPMLPAIIFMRLTGALGLAPLAPYHALMYGRSLYFDITKARTELGWQPRYSNEEMFVQSYDWYLRNRERVLSQRGSSPHRSPIKEGVLSIVKRLL
ncbi:MAG: NAD-dependent epimerase/dehydratase family protein [Verrucomicrobiae bacterium]|nr:NAD-dependent epimerase/dehydratase family protein [Verrucomicrobiae bacterium]